MLSALIVLPILGSLLLFLGLGGRKLAVVLAGSRWPSRYFCLPASTCRRPAFSGSSGGIGSRKSG